MIKKLRNFFNKNIIFAILDSKNEDNKKEVKISYSDSIRREINKSNSNNKRNPYCFPIKPPDIMPGVIPKGVKAPVLAMDSDIGLNPYTIFQGVQSIGTGFPGYAYLAQLANRSEFRAPASAISTELTREWIKFTSCKNDGDSNDKIRLIEEEFKRLDVKGVIQKVSEQECLFGRGQIFINIKNSDRSIPLVISAATIGKNSLQSIVPIEAMWTTPSMYNAIDPAAPDFYRPTAWFMLGQEIHASRLLTIITRPVPDMLKAAFNFSGISLSQLGQPYVDNWLRTRQSVADLISNFSIIGLGTDLNQRLQGSGYGEGFTERAELFTNHRNNKNLFLFNRDTEALMQLAVPLGGLSELQSQAQEHMCAVFLIPSIILLGITPNGFNASSEGELVAWRQRIHSIQNAYYYHPIDIILKIVQLSLFGEIDPDISFCFNSLYQLSEKEKSDIRLQDSQIATAYVTAGILDPVEERERLAADPNSLYQGLDVTAEVIPPIDPTEENDPADEEDEDDDDDDSDEKAEDKSVSEAQQI